MPQSSSTNKSPSKAAPSSGKEATSSSVRAGRKQRVISVPDAVIGRVERVDLPDWDVEGLKAKVDTGARTSSIHVEDLRVLKRNQVQFAVVLQDGGRLYVQTAISRTGRVRSSNGQLEKRYFVRTHVRIGPVLKEVEVSLTGRASMTYRMLLGRLALEGDFVVDVSHRFIADRQTQPRKARRSS